VSHLLAIEHVAIEALPPSPHQARTVQINSHEQKRSYENHQAKMALMGVIPATWEAEEG
jgi:hypothetical protein